MPVLRLLAEDALALGSAGTVDQYAEPVFTVGQGNIEALVVDCTGWLGLGDTLSTSTWVTDLTTGSATITGAIASVRVTIPVSPLIPDWTLGSMAGQYLVTHTAVSAGGRQRVTRIWLVAS